MAVHLKLLTAKLKHNRFDASSERSCKLTHQLELELGELVTAASEDAAKAATTAGKDTSSAGATPRQALPLTNHSLGRMHT